MNILNGLKNFLELIEQNWTLIIIVAGLLLSVYKKVANYLSKSDEEKIEIAKRQAQELILKLVSDAEQDYSQWLKAGGIKRSQVIARIFEEYPILSKVTNQEELIAWMDEAIDNALDELRKIVDENGGTVPTGDSSK